MGRTPACGRARPAPSDGHELAQNLPDSHEVERASDPEVFIGVLDARREAPSLTVRSTRAGAIQAVDADAMVSWARKQDCLIVLRHAIGDFVPLRGHAARCVYGGNDHDARAEQRLADMVALGDELTRLDATVTQSFGGSVDLDRASAADTQGIGGPRTRPVDRTSA
jgi:hypothetical protein